MALRIMSNPSSLNAQRNLSKTQSTNQESLRRLSSGLRINSAADDAAGLAISERLRAQIRSLGQAERNANDGISMMQTAEGALNEISGILTRMRELSVQSANGTLGSSDRDALNTEFTALNSEINRIADVTEFNDTRLIDGSLSGSSNALQFQVGINGSSANQISRQVANMHASQLGTNAASGGGGTPAVSINVIDISTVSGAKTALATIDQAITDSSENRADLGATMNRLAVTVANLQSARENLSAANSRIRDVDVASESANLTRSNILMQAGVAVLAQANQQPALSLALIG